MVNNYLKALGILLLAVVIFFGGRASVGGLSFGDSSTSLPNGLTVGGGTYASVPAFSVTGASVFGAAGTSISQVIAGGTSLCVLGTKGPGNINSSQAASTTVVYDCPITGVIAGDAVMAEFASSTVMGMNGWEITMAKASSTSGFIELGLYNGTGANAIPSVSGAGSSTSVLIIR